MDVILFDQQNPQPFFTKEVVDVTGGSDDEDLVEVNKALGAIGVVITAKLIGAHPT